MKTEEIIYRYISEDDTLKNIVYNCNTKKIELNGEKILSYIYDDILYNIKQEWPDVKILKRDITKIVEKYAHDHKIEKKKEENIPDTSTIYKLNKKGIPIRNLYNAIVFFENNPKYKGKFSYNEFTCYEEFNNDLIRDYHIPAMRLDLENELYYNSRDIVEAAIQYLTHKSSYNPFKKSLENIVWDGEERAETLFIDKIGVYDTKLNRILTKKWLYAMIKRLYEPGCNFDNMLIVYDAKQGTGKSKIIQRLVECLGMNYGYDTSITCDNKDKDNIDKLNKTWVVGIDEMNDFLKKTPEQTKQFLAQTSDTARLSYARRSELYKRHCVFYGSSNIEYFLKDYTSNFERRYWIMDAEGEVHDSKWWKENLSDEYLQQVLAEMKYFYDANPDFNYSTLEIDEMKDLEEVQYNHKTLNNDVVLKFDIEKILNKMYTKNIFKDYDEFEKEALDTTICMNDKSTNEFFGISDNDDNFNGYIERIPVKWLKIFIEKHLGRNISTQYITSLLKNEWKYKACKYPEKAINCYQRIYKETI